MAARNSVFARGHVLGGLMHGKKVEVASIQQIFRAGGAHADCYRLVGKDETALRVFGVDAVWHVLGERSEKNALVGRVEHRVSFDIDSASLACLQALRCFAVDEHALRDLQRAGLEASLFGDAFEHCEINPDHRVVFLHWGSKLSD